jgi:hypothetical protein
MKRGTSIISNKSAAAVVVAKKYTKTKREG